MTFSPPTIPDLGPLEDAPEDIRIVTRTGRRLIVSRAKDVVVIREASPGLRRVLAALDGDNARGLSDALQWAANSLRMHK